MTPDELARELGLQRNRMEGVSQEIISFCRSLPFVLRDAGREHAAKEIERLLFNYDALVGEMGAHGDAAGTQAVKRNAAIRGCLAKGPCTSAEIAAILGIPARSAQVGVWVLCDIGHAQVSGRAFAPGTRASKLYALTPRGELFNRRYPA
jgi:hypothetical protein